MKDGKSQEIVVLVWGTAQEIYDARSRENVVLSEENIVEVAAVKIIDGEIQGHFHSFVAIDGYDAKEFEFTDLNFSYNLSSLHLIGAPTLESVVRDLRAYIGDSVVALPDVSARESSPFAILRDKAKSLGVPLENTVISIWDVVMSARLDEERQDGVNIEDRERLKADYMYNGDNCTWGDMFDEYNIIFNPDSPDSFDRDRNDPLSWALVLAQLLVKHIEYYGDFVIDPDCPF